MRNANVDSHNANKCTNLNCDAHVLVTFTVSFLYSVYKAHL